MTEITTTSATPPLEHFEVPNYAVLQAFFAPSFLNKGQEIHSVFDKIISTIIT